MNDSNTLLEGAKPNFTNSDGAVPVAGTVIAAGGCGLGGVWACEGGAAPPVAPIVAAAVVVLGD